MSSLTFDATLEGSRFHGDSTRFRNGDFREPGWVEFRVVWWWRESGEVLRRAKGARLQDDNITSALLQRSGIGPRLPGWLMGGSSFGLFGTIAKSFASCGQYRRWRESAEVLRRAKGARLQDDNIASALLQRSGIGPRLPGRLMGGSSFGLSGTIAKSFASCRLYRWWRESAEVLRRAKGARLQDDNITSAEWLRAATSRPFDGRGGCHHMALRGGFHSLGACLCEQKTPLLRQTAHEKWGTHPECALYGVRGVDWMLDAAYVPSAGQSKRWLGTPSL